MKEKKALQLAGMTILALALIALGYWWGQNDKNVVQSSPTATHSTAGHGETGSQADAPGSVNVSPEKQQLVGIRTAVAELRPLTKKIRTVGIVTYDETKVAQVYTKVDGWIEKLFVNYTGKLVEKGQPLFTFYSPELVSTQEEYLLAVDAKKTLGSSSLQEIRSGSASLLEAARRRLSLWDISEEQIEELQRRGEPTRTLTLFSPLTGFVIKKDAFQGMKVMPDKELYTIADLSTVWVNADIYEFELANVRVGQTAAITLSYFPGQAFYGRVSWISPVLDEKTRTTKVRLELQNPDFKLKPEMYTNVEIGVDAGRKLAIPDEAVLDSGLRKVVFLDKGEGRFQPAEVKLGGKFDGYHEVLSGLSPGERVLASAGFLLDSESRLTEAMGAMAGMAGMDMGEGGKTAAAKESPREKKSGELTLALDTQPAKPKAGEITLRLRVKDSKGNPVQDAKVSFNIVMAMPGMAPSKADGKLSGDGFYEAKANLAMAGEWEVTVEIRRPGQKETQEKFKLITQQ